MRTVRVASWTRRSAEPGWNFRSRSGRLLVGRAGAGVMRLIRYPQGWDFATWSMLYSDDGWITGRTKQFEKALIMHLFILVLIKTPLAWHKLCGGIQSERIGYALDVGRFEIGITEARGPGPMGHSLVRRQGRRKKGALG